MRLVLCRNCGAFVPGFPDRDDGVIPAREECPDCGGTEFTDHETDHRVASG